MRAFHQHDRRMRIELLRGWSCTSCAARQSQLDAGVTHDCRAHARCRPSRRIRDASFHQGRDDLLRLAAPLAKWRLAAGHRRRSLRRRCRSRTRQTSWFLWWRARQGTSFRAHPVVKRDCMLVSSQAAHRRCAHVQTWIFGQRSQHKQRILGLDAIFVDFEFLVAGDAVSRPGSRNIFAGISRWLEKIELPNSSWKSR